MKIRLILLASVLSLVVLCQPYAQTTFKRPDLVITEVAAVTGNANAVNVHIVNKGNAPSNGCALGLTLYPQSQGSCVGPEVKKADTDVPAISSAGTPGRTPTDR